MNAPTNLILWTVKKDEKPVLKKKDVNGTIFEPAYRKVIQYHRGY